MHSFDGPLGRAYVGLIVGKSLGDANGIALGRAGVHRGHGVGEPALTARRNVTAPCSRFTESGL